MMHFLNASARHSDLRVRDSGALGVARILERLVKKPA